MQMNFGMTYVFKLKLGLDLQQKSGQKVKLHFLVG